MKTISIGQKYRDQQEVEIENQKCLYKELEKQNIQLNSDLQRKIEACAIQEQYSKSPLELMEKLEDYLDDHE